MIHRFVDLLEVVGVPGIVFLTRESSPSNQHVLYQVPDLVSPGTPVKMTQTIVSTGDGSDFLSDCELSPDGLNVLYCRHGVGSPAHSEVMVVDWDNTADVTLYSEPSARNGILKPTWKPDGTKILFRSSSVGSAVLTEIKHMDPDGSNVATLYSGSNIVGDPLYSPDGTLIAFGESGAIKVMNADGTGLATIVASGTGFPTWFRTQNVVAYIATGVPGWRKINADGSGGTTLSTNFITGQDPSAVKWSVLPDDSAIVTTNYVSTDPSPNHHLVYIATDGSGVTAMSPQRSIATGTPDTRPVCLGERIYFPDSDPFTHLASVALDGSDYRVDFDGDALSPDVVFHGFKGDTLNI